MSRENQNKRIGLLIDSLIGGGAERVVLNFAEKFAELGHDVHVLLIRDEIEHETGDLRIHALSEDGKLARSRPINKLLLARRMREIVASIEADGKRFDFFISNAEDSDRISGIARLPKVFIRYRNSMVHFLDRKIGNATGVKRAIRRFRWLRKFQRIYGARHIITVSKALEQELVEVIGIRPASITTIYNPFDFERLRRLASEPAPVPDVPYVVYVARFGERKNQELLVRAFVEANIPHKLVLVGGAYSDAERAYLERLKSLIAELGIGDRVILPGFQKNPYPWIKHAALFGMASESEGLPTVLIESLILGTPVVSTDCPTGPREILTGKLASYLSPVGDASALARNIRKALVEYPPIDDESLARFRSDCVIRQYLEHAASVTRGKAQ